MPAMLNIPDISWSILSTYGDFESAEKYGSKLADLGVSYIHYDISSHDKTMRAADIPKYRAVLDLPFDVHIATDRPQQSSLETLEHLQKGDFIAVHVEDLYQVDLQELRTICDEKHVNLGIALNVETDISTCMAYAGKVDYLLVMAAEPGVSGGSFSPSSFEKVLSAKKLFPSLGIHVDGGVDQYSSAMLREAGVDVLISGSYLMKGSEAIKFSNLIGRNILVDIGAVMRTGDRLPKVHITDSIAQVAEAITTGGIGSVCVLDEDDCFAGLITDGDLRRIFMDGVIPDRAAAIINPVPEICEKIGQSSYQFLRKKNKDGTVRAVYPVVVDKKCVGMLVTADLVFHR